MSKDIKNFFLSVLQKCELNYIPYQLQNVPKIKDYMRQEDFKRQYQPKVEIAKIKNLCVSSDNSINPFITFYSLDEECIKDLYYLLNKTQQAINYYNNYSEQYRELMAKNTHNNSKSEKIIEVMRIVKELDKDAREYYDKNSSEQLEVQNNWNIKHSKAITTIEYLSSIVNSLDNNHYTQKQLFQNLLYEINLLLQDKKISKNKIYTITNLLIKEYFASDIQFTTKTNINKFKHYNYQYETRAGIDLMHT